MKEIKLTQGQVALVDDEDYEYLNQWKWHYYLKKNHNTTYAYRNIKNNFNKWSTIDMHRFIINPKPHQFIDHIDHNGLNNCRSNLRICTLSENGLNRLPNKGKKYKGTTKLKNGKYQTYFRTKYIGCFNSEKEAAKAYNIEAKRYNNEYCLLNEL